VLGCSKIPSISFLFSSDAGTINLNVYNEGNCSVSASLSLKLLASDLPDPPSEVPAAGAAAAFKQ